MNKTNKPTIDSLDNYDNIFSFKKATLTPYQKKRGEVEGLFCIEIPEESLFIFTKHPERKESLLKKYRERHFNVINTNKYEI
jgi:hypothetical protein